MNNKANIHSDPQLWKRKYQRYIDIILYRSYADLKTEASRSFLGFTWWLIEPILYMCAFYVVFEMGLRRGGDDFIPFLLIGLIFWKWFASTVISSSKSISANKGIINQVYIPKLLFPLTVITTNSTKFIFSLFVLLIFLILYGYSSEINIAHLLIVIFLELLLISGCSIISASITPFFHEFKLILDNGILAMMFISGIFFNIMEMEEKTREILLYNPVAIIIYNARSVLIDNGLPEDHNLLYVLGISLVLIVSGVFITWRNDRVYAKVVM